MQQQCSAANKTIAHTSLNATHVSAGVRVCVCVCEGLGTGAKWGSRAVTDLSKCNNNNNNNKICAWKLNERIKSWIAPKDLTWITCRANGKCSLNWYSWIRHAAILQINTHTQHIYIYVYIYINICTTLIASLAARLFVCARSSFVLFALSTNFAIIFKKKKKKKEHKIRNKIVCKTIRM